MSQDTAEQAEVQATLEDFPIWLAALTRLRQAEDFQSVLAQHQAEEMTIQPVGGPEQRLYSAFVLEPEDYPSAYRFAAVVASGCYTTKMMLDFREDGTLMGLSPAYNRALQAVGIQAYIWIVPEGFEDAGEMAVVLDMGGYYI